MFTVKDLQQRYDVTERTVLLWIQSGELKAMHMGRRMGSKKPRWRVSQAALDAFEALRTATPSAQPVRRRKAEDVISFIK